MAKSEWHHLYGTSRWQRMRKAQLTAEPLCAFCLQTEDVTPATVADHVKAHKGDLSLFYDPNNLQSLCKPHHDGAKQRIDRGFKAVEIGVDGYPIEIG
jgi:5-methylcytosine-specific restriction enzyme A